MSQYFILLQGNRNFQEYNIMFILLYRLLPLISFYIFHNYYFCGHFSLLNSIILRNKNIIVVNGFSL